MGKVIQFVKDSIDELKFKVSWPKYSELQSHTVMVLIGTALFALLVFVIDFIFENGMSEIYKSL